MPRQNKCNRWQFVQSVHRDTENVLNHTTPLTVCAQKTCPPRSCKAWTFARIAYNIRCPVCLQGQRLSGESQSTEAPNVSLLSTCSARLLSFIRFLYSPFPYSLCRVANRTLAWLTSLPFLFFVFSLSLFSRFLQLLNNLNRVFIERNVLQNAGPAFRLRRSTKRREPLEILSSALTGAKKAERGS